MATSPNEHNLLLQKDTESTSAAAQSGPSTPDVVEDIADMSEEDRQTVSSQSQSSQVSVPEEEISIWVDEMETQNTKRQKLNEAVSNIADGRYSPVMSTLNTAWDDVIVRTATLLRPKSKREHCCVLVSDCSWPRGFVVGNN